MSRIEHKIPEWAASLVDLGEKFVTSVDQQKARRLTLTICLPCMNYAAAFIGIGVVKGRVSGTSAGSHKERLESLLGHWVSYEKNHRTSVGILEFRSDDDKFRIKLEKHGLWVIFEKEDWPRVRPTGREFNPKRRISRRQTKKVEDQNRSISVLSDLFECNLWGAALGMSGRIFSVYGNKTRLNQELSESLYTNDEASLGRILRPESHLDYGESSHCAVEANRSPLPDEDGAIVVIEAGRSLPDQLAASRQLSRIILLARNAADYENCAAAMMEQSSLRITEGPPIDIRMPSSIITLPFYHR